MGLGGAFADEQLTGDLRVGATAGEQDQHLALPLGEPVELRRGARAAGGEALDQPPGQLGSDQGAAVGGGPDPEQQFPGLDTGELAYSTIASSLPRRACW